MNRTAFLREQTLRGANKCRRTPIPPVSFADEPCSLTERKAMGLKFIFDHMPVYIGPQELIVGTRTFFTPNPGNEDGHDVFGYGTGTPIPYLHPRDIERFGCDQSYYNKTHATPDFRIILQKGIRGILTEAEQKQRDPALHSVQAEFLRGVILAYTGLQDLIARYAEEAETLAEKAEGERREELEEIARICRKIRTDPPDSFQEALQLLWFAHLGVIIESFEFISYGRLDVLLGDYLKDTPKEKAAQLTECLLLKMYDQTDLETTYLGKYAGQLIVTLGGVLPDGRDAVNDVTMLFLDAIDKTRLPDPEFNLRISSKNPPVFLDRAAELTISGCNNISYFNDDLFVENLHRRGIPLEDARDYGFDLCQDINIPGRGDFWIAGTVYVAHTLMDLLARDCSFTDFKSLMDALKADIAQTLRSIVEQYNRAEEQMCLYAGGDTDAYFDGIRKGKPVDRNYSSPMAPLPLMSPLFHGCLEKALDVAFEPYPIPAKGIIFGTVVEALNALAAIRKTVFDERKYSLEAVYRACENNFEGEEGTYLQSLLWNCPKWGNDDDEVDSIAAELMDFCLRECQKYQTYLGGPILAGIHQAHPVPTGRDLMATPEGRKRGVPAAVTLSPENGTMKNGPTAALSSAAKIDSSLVQWNFCVMINYFASVFRGNDGKEIFKTLLTEYFKAGGLQHQPNICDTETLKKAQLEPEKYKDLIVRLWGVSAHFVDLPKELQDEMIARFS